MGRYSDEDIDSLSNLLRNRELLYRPYNDFVNILSKENVNYQHIIQKINNYNINILDLDPNDLSLKMKYIINKTNKLQTKTKEELLDQRTPIAILFLYNFLLYKPELIKNVFRSISGDLNNDINYIMCYITGLVIDKNPLYNFLVSNNKQIRYMSSNLITNNITSYKFKSHISKDKIFHWIQDINEKTYIKNIINFYLNQIDSIIERHLEKLKIYSNDYIINEYIKILDLDINDYIEQYTCIPNLIERYNEL
jgi:hypothetical protein